MPKHISLKDTVYNYIAQKIQNGELFPNEKINENEICRELGISRTPAREALIQLASSETIDYLPRKGFFVREIDTKTKLDQYVIIAALDALAATSAMQFIDENDIKKMREQIAKIEVAIEYQNYPDYLAEQRRFHDIYTNKSNNPSLIRMLDSLKESFIHQTYFSQDSDRLFRILDKINEQHKEILRCFIEKEEEKLEKILKKQHWETEYEDLI